MCQVKIHNSIFIVLISLLITSSVLVVSVSDAQLVKANPKTIIVPDDYPTIQAAIDNASQDSTVFVKSGTYHETLTIEKPLSLIGEDSQNTIIKGIWNGHIQRPTIQISSDNVTISGFTIRDSLQVGIWVERIGSNKQPLGCHIIGNNIMNNTLGIHTFGMSNPTTGIRYPSNLVISDNTITQNTEYGIYCTTSNSTISGNNVTDNGWEGIIIDECVNVTVRGNNIKRNSRGLLLRWWGPFYVFGNNITDTGVGVVFGEYCSNSRVYEKNIAENSIGIQLDNVGDPDLIGKYNIVYNNNLVNNYQQVTVNPNSDVVSWDNNREGNYWSDYNGKDANSDGIGDTPYVIDANNKDRYPLMRPIAIPEFPNVLISTTLFIVMAIVVVLSQLKIKRNSVDQ